jgi:hypothetical protein
VCLGLALNWPTLRGGGHRRPDCADLRALLAKGLLLEVRTVDEAQALSDLRRGRWTWNVRKGEDGASLYELDASRPEATIA